MPVSRKRLFYLAIQHQREIPSKGLLGDVIPRHRMQASGVCARTCVRMGRCSSLALDAQMGWVGYVCVCVCVCVCGGGASALPAAAAAAASLEGRSWSRSCKRSAAAAGSSNQFAGTQLHLSWTTSHANFQW